MMLLMPLAHFWSAQVSNAEVKQQFMPCVRCSADDNDAVLLIDASNAFNSLNRSAALHNIRILCPTLATFAINTYRKPAGLFITGGKEIKSPEGTTQGDPIAMGLYAVSLQPLITHLNLFSSARQCWFADDAIAAGILEELKIWWDELVTDGQLLGYFPNAKKCWQITKERKRKKNGPRQCLMVLQ